MYPINCRHEIVILSHHSAINCIPVASLPVRSGGGGGGGGWGGGGGGDFTGGKLAKINTSAIIIMNFNQVIPLRSFTCERVYMCMCAYIMWGVLICICYLSQHLSQDISLLLS